MTREQMQMALEGGALLVALLALLVAIASAVFSHGQRQAGRRQAAASEAQVEASLRQAAAAEAQVEVMQRQVVSMEEQTHVAAPPVPPWALRHVRGDTYVIVNGGRTTAHDVKITVPEGVAHRGDLEHKRIEPGSEVTLMLTRSWGSGSTLGVSWSPDARGSARLSWEGAIPPKR